jgi:hypothetical protein
MYVTPGKHLISRRGQNPNAATDIDVDTLTELGLKRRCQPSWAPIREMRPTFVTTYQCGRSASSLALASQVCNRVGSRTARTGSSLIERLWK